ncbi:MAG TPA: hypothetical protein VNN17_10380, partial [Terriglobia bacterium]|nr:hypothetical protein [Terriglobia bacterium]
MAACLAAGLAFQPAARGQALQFDVTTIPSVVVANTGLSEVLSDLSLIAKPACGTETDAFCVSSAEKIEVRFNNITIDNSASTGILICETISGFFSCNQEGLFMTGVITVAGNTVSIGVKQGVNLAAFDRLSIAGVRARIAESVLATPGLETIAVVSAVPAAAATFPTDALVVAHSANPLSLLVTSVPEVPCTAEDVIPTILVQEGYATAFADYADPLERSFPGQPVLARNPFGANSSIRIRLALTGLVSGVQIQWPLTITAQNAGSKLDLIEQSEDGSTATYLYSAPTQLPNDNLSEVFAVRLRPENFRFSGTG